MLGTLSVLRSNALSTGQNVVRALLGTMVGFVVGAALLAVIGTNTTLLWLLLPIAVLLAGFAPAAISFAAGQAAFTLTLVILFNIIAPVGWQVGLVRVEDVALGCAVSLAVGAALLAARGGRRRSAVALADAYADSAGYLAGAVDFGMARCDEGTPSRARPIDEALRAAAASRRLDDAFRGYLAERGAKRIPLADVTALVTGAWACASPATRCSTCGSATRTRGRATVAARGRDLLPATATVVGWYDDLAASLTGRRAPRAAAPRRSSRPAPGRRRPPRPAGKDGRASAGVRMIWTGDHLDAARRFQASLVGPAQTATEQGALVPVGAVRGLVARRARSSGRSGDGDVGVPQRQAGTEDQPGEGAGQDQGEVVGPGRDPVEVLHGGKDDDADR